MKKLFGNNYGFSLIELSVVITIVGLLVGGGIVIVSENVEAARINETRNRINFILKAIDDFVDEKTSLTRGFLPCPADGSAAFGAATFGFESKTGSSCTAIANGVITTDSRVAVGAVPVYTLNLPPLYALDGWDRRFTYVVDKAMNTSANYSNNTGRIEIRTINNQAMATDGAVAIVSHGGNGFRAWQGRGGTTRIAAVSNEEIENGDDDYIIYQSLQTRTATGDFDDIIGYTTKWKLDGEE